MSESEAKSNHPCRMLSAISRVPVLVALVLLYALFAFYIFPNSGYDSSVGPLDLKFSYSSETAYKMIAAYGEEGRARYARSVMTVDVAYPIVYTLLFMVWLTLVLKGTDMKRKGALFLTLLVFDALAATNMLSLTTYAQDGVGAPTDVQREVREGRIDVRIDGQELTEGEEVAIATVFHSLMSDAISAAINEGIAQMLAALGANDDLEKSLVIGSLSGDSPKVGDEATISIYLVRSGDLTKTPRTIEIRLGDQCWVRYCRVYAPIQHPIAIVTETVSEKGGTSISERIMRYDDTSKWKANVARIAMK